MGATSFLPCNSYRRNNLSSPSLPYSMKVQHALCTQSWQFQSGCWQPTTDLAWGTVSYAPQETSNFLTSSFLALKFCACKILVTEKHFMLFQSSFISQLSHSSPRQMKLGVIYKVFLPSVKVALTFILWDNLVTLILTRCWGSDTISKYWDCSLLPRQASFEHPVD